METLYTYLCTPVISKEILLVQELIKPIKYCLFILWLNLQLVTHLCTLHSFKNIPHCIGKGVNQYSTQLLVQGTQTYHSSTETAFKLEISH